MGSGAGDNGREEGTDVNGDREDNAVVGTGI
jgi:hypothetical protein